MLPVTWTSRTERSDGKNSPEELISAANASCYSMAFSHTLAQEGHLPDILIVDTVCTLEDVQGTLKITTTTLNVRGKMLGIDEATFVQLAQKAEKGCPVSSVLRGGLQIHLDTHLEYKISPYISVKKLT